MIKPFGSCSSPELSQLFSGFSGQPCPYRLFLTKFGELPSLSTAQRIKTDLFLRTFISRFNDRIDFLRTVEVIKGLESMSVEPSYWLGMASVLVVVDPQADEVSIYYAAAAGEMVQEIETIAKECRQKRTRVEPFVHVVAMNGRGLDIVPMRVNRPKVDLEQHYNTDFKEVHETIRKRLNRKNDKGIVLLHGLPGTGKTTYLRYLISTVKKDVIFIPPGFADRLTDPGFMSLLMSRPNSVLVIEDAERVLADREREGHSAVSVLLNLSDGLLSDCLNIQLICTFNTHLSRIDQALLRQGRLIARYCFRELEAEKAGALLVAQGKAFEVARPMTLAEIYGDAHPSIQEPFQTKEAIGFRVQKAG